MATDVEEMQETMREGKIDGQQPNQALGIQIGC